MPQLAVNCLYFLMGTCCCHLLFTLNSLVISNRSFHKCVKLYNILNCLWKCDSISMRLVIYLVRHIFTVWFTELMTHWVVYWTPSKIWWWNNGSLYAYSLGSLTIWNSKILTCFVTFIRSDASNSYNYSWSRLDRTIYVLAF